MEVAATGTASRPSMEALLYFGNARIDLMSRRIKPRDGRRDSDGRDAECDPES